MRVTRETQERTRTEILVAARALFGEVGFATTTTRAIAGRAGIAAGTLFNYFPSKESLGQAVLREAVEAAETEFDAKRRAGEPLEEALFAFVAIQLRRLEPHRRWIGDVLVTGASPLRTRADDNADGLRVLILQRVAALLSDHGHESDGLITLHLFWTLYLGVLEFWARDDSRRHESTLALLDRSMNLFSQSLREEPRGA